MTRWGISSGALPDPQTRERRVSTGYQRAGEEAKEGSYDTLLEDITRNIGLLEKLVPQITDSQRKLYHVKREEVGDGKQELAMELLRDVPNTDSSLGQTAQEVIGSRIAGHTWERTEVHDNAKVEQGDRIASGFVGQAPAVRVNHKFGVTIVKGNAVVYQGDIYGQV
ncbi:hypothetical protein GGI43DRAFT_384583 [Trichoderma evansii]